MFKQYSNIQEPYPRYLLHCHHFTTITQENSITNFFIKRSNTELGKQFKQVVGARIWSEAPVDIKDLTFPLFVYKYEQYLISKYE